MVLQGAKVKNLSPHPLCKLSGQENSNQLFACRLNTIKLQHYGNIPGNLHTVSCVFKDLKGLEYWIMGIKVFNIVIILSWIVAYKLHVQNEIYMYSNEIHFVLEWNVFPSSLS